MSGLALGAAPALHTSLSPRLQHAVKLLQMSSLDFSQVLSNALGSNPFLEAEEGTDEACDEFAAPASADEGIDRSWPSSEARRHHAAAGSEALDHLQAPGTLAGHLAAQLELLPLPERDLALALAVANSLDEDGYLRVPVEEVVSGLGLRAPARPGECQIALRRVQALDPAGVGARDLVECLCLQLHQVEPPALRALARDILTRHLRALAARDLPALARRLQRPAAEIEAACGAIRRLDPRPGWRHGAGVVPYITPDLIVRRQRGQWAVDLNPAVVPRLRLNERYAALLAQHRNGTHPALAAQLQEARWTLRNVEQRFATIVDVAGAILRRQHRFLAYGPMAMRPLALRDIAQELGMHESTVSRVTHDKFMATPRGVFELKYFFSRALSTANGGACSPTAVRGLIRELIDAEPAARPLSDVDLARELAVQGLKVARRTVTKYRQQLRIEPAQRRGQAG